MSKLENIGLYLGISASIIAIVDWLSKSISLFSYIVNIVIFLVFNLIQFFSWLFRPFFIELPIWSFLLFLMGIVLFLFLFMKLKNSQVFITEEKLLKVYESFSKNEQNIFLVISTIVNKREECTLTTLENIVERNRLNISILEITQILEFLIDRKLIWISKTFISTQDDTYHLTTIGRNLAVRIMKKQNS